MLIKPQTIEELKQLQMKLFFSVTDKVTKITDASVLNGIFYANAKLAQKMLKDIAISQSHLYPDYSFGQYLDNSASQMGVTPRHSSSPSTTYVRLVGEVGTFYNSSLHVISGNGVSFTMSNSVTIPDSGWAYVLVQSNTSGLNTNVEAFSLNTISNKPVGHIGVTNEYAAQGGRDVESDDVFRYRIKNFTNMAATGTLSKIEQIFMNFDQRVLRVFNAGSERNGKIIFYVLGVSGQIFSDSDFNNMLKKYLQFFSMTEVNIDYLPNAGIELRNVNWKPVDIGFRCRLKEGSDAETVRRDAQINISKELDYRTWELGKKVEWDNLLQIVKQTKGIDYVSDNFFTPNADLAIGYGELPRVRGFQMLDLDGALLSDGGGVLNSFFYPNNFEFSTNRLFYRNLI